METDKEAISHRDTEGFPGRCCRSSHPGATREAQVGTPVQGKMQEEGSAWPDDTGGHSGVTQDCHLGALQELLFFPPFPF